MTLLFSWLGIIWKIFTILFVGVFEFDNIKSSIMSMMKKGNKTTYKEFEDENENENEPGV